MDHCLFCQKYEPIFRSLRAGDQLVAKRDYGLARPMSQLLKGKTYEVIGTTTEHSFHPYWVKVRVEFGSLMFGSQESVNFYRICLMVDDLFEISTAPLREKRMQFVAEVFGFKSKEELEAFLDETDS